MRVDMVLDIPISIDIKYRHDIRQKIVMIVDKPVNKIVDKLVDVRWYCKCFRCIRYTCRHDTRCTCRHDIRHDIKYACTVNMILDIPLDMI